MIPGQRCTRVAEHKGQHSHALAEDVDWVFFFGKHERCTYVEPPEQGAPEGLMSVPMPALQPAPAPSLEEALARLRSAGWMVAVHNDYRQDGKLMTFWLFTRADETGKMVAVKGEGPTDDEALAQVYRQVTGR